MTSVRNNSYYYNKKFEIEYKELKDDGGVFESFYELDSVKHAQMTAIPDGRVDIQCVWKENQLSMFVCGSVLNGVHSQVSNFDKCFCARFRIGILPERVRNHLDIIVDNRVPLNDILEIPKLEKYLTKDLCIEKKADIMMMLFETEPELKNNFMIDYLVKEIGKHKGHISVKDMIEQSGYSHRYANFVFKNNVGCSIKKFASIVRLQESFKLLLDRNDDAIYSELGYYDQAHFIKDFKNFAATTPNTIKKIADQVIFL